MADAHLPARSHPVPAPDPAREVLFGLPIAGKRWPGGLRAALALGIPALVAMALGYEQEAVTVTLGAFAVIYGEGRPDRARWKVVGLAAVALVASAWVAALVGTPVHRAIAEGGSSALLLWVVLTMSGVALVCAYTVGALRLGPPGAFFIVLAAEVGSMIVASGMSATEVAGWSAVGGISALAVSMSGALWAGRSVERAATSAAASAVEAYVDHRESGETAPRARHLASLKLQAAWQSLYDGRLLDRAHPLVDELGATQVRLSAAIRQDPTVDPTSDLDDIRPQAPMPRPGPRYRFLRALHPASHSWTAAVRLLLACLLAGSIAVVLHIDRPDWAVITAALVLHQGPDRILGTYRGLHRIGGTVLGVVLFGALYALNLSGVWLILVLMVLQLLIELFMARNYGLAVTFITPMAILIGNAGHHGNALPVIWDRLVETAFGVVVALAVLWTVDRHSHRRILTWADGRVAMLIRQTVQALDSGEAAGHALMALRRDLEFELTGSAMAGVDAAHNEPAWTKARWPAHSELHHLGFDVLAGFWSTPAGMPPDARQVREWDRQLSAIQHG